MSSIEQQLGFKFPIYWNEWSIEKEFAKYLIYRIITSRPINVVELGSGLSSLIMLKTLNKLGYYYTLTSFESDKCFLEMTKNLLISEGVYNEKKVKLIHSSISDNEINSTIYKWYTVDDFLFSFDKIDLLFVDGPPGGLCRNSRYPAVNVIRKYIREGSVIILHDAKRIDEIEIVEMWKKDNPDIKSINEIDTPRGGVEIIF